MGNSVTLHSACEYGDLSSFKDMLNTCTQEDLEVQDDNGRTPLLVAVAAMKKKDEEEDDQLNGFGLFDDLDDDEEPDHDQEFIAIHRRSKLAAPEQQVEDVSTENTEGINNDNVELCDESTVSSVELTSKAAEIVHLLLQKQVCVDHQDENGWTALHHACYIQNHVAIRMLIHAGAHPMRDKCGLLPQDLLMKTQVSEWAAQVPELKEELNEMTEKTPYSIKLLAFRPSGIVQLDMGAQVEKGSLVTIEYDVPENHSPKDYIQVLISSQNSADIEMGSHHQVPSNAHGQITININDIPASSTVRFVYVKTDINKMSRQVVASGCNAVVQASVGEIFQYELYLYERVVEVESIPEFEFVDQPLMVLKRIGIVVNETEIEWVVIRPDNHIVAVNDIRIESMEFAEAVRVLQENNGKECTKLLMQNYSACGDFIPEKILGVGVIGRFAHLHAVHDVKEHQLDAWVAGQIPTDSTSPPPAPVSTPSEVTGEDSQPSPSQESSESSLHTALDSKLVLMESPEQDKVSSSSTIETVVPLHNSRQLVEQLQFGITFTR